MADDSASAAKSLNEQNWPGLLAITALNVIVFAVAVGVGPTPFSKLTAAWAFLLPAGVGLALIRVINGLFPAKVKDCLVFWKLQNPLPGSQAFSFYAANDDRFKIEDVKAKLRDDLKVGEEKKDEELTGFWPIQRSRMLIGTTRFTIRRRTSRV
jgi:hypothetical protein